MNINLSNHIRLLAGEQQAIPNWTDRVDAVISDWDRYFSVYGISDDEQDRELHAIISQRVMVGIISIAAPSAQEYGLHKIKE